MRRREVVTVSRGDDTKDSFTETFTTREVDPTERYVPRLSKKFTSPFIRSTLTTKIVVERLHLNE